MKALPATLLILSGRPPAGADAEADRIANELQDPHRPLPVTKLLLGEFGLLAAHSYLAKSGISAGLTKDEGEKLVHLTRGHPLWLAFTVDYLNGVGMPKEAAENSLARIKAALPYGGEMTPAG